MGDPQPCDCPWSAIVRFSSCTAREHAARRLQTCGHTCAHDEARFPFHLSCPVASWPLPTHDERWIRWRLAIVGAGPDVERTIAMMSRDAREAYVRRLDAVLSTDDRGGLVVHIAKLAHGPVSSPLASLHA